MILLKPTAEDEAEFVEMMRTWKECGGKIYPGLLRYYDGDYKKWLGIIERYREGKVRSGEIPQSFYFAKEGSAILGAVSLRDRLDTKKIGRNISFGIHPKHRRKGYGEELLRLALQQICHEFGLFVVTLSCDSDSIPSKRIIEHSGGVLTKQAYQKDRLLNVYVLREFSGPLMN